MREEYVVVTRTSNKNRTVLPKPYMMAKELKFFVKSHLASRFPKRFDVRCMYMADLIMADGVVIKNRFGPTF